MNESTPITASSALDAPAVAAAAPVVASPAQIAAARSLGRSLATRMPSTLPRGVYQHYKNRELYLVEGLARHTETEQMLVLYQALYTSDSNPERTRFVRPLDMFIENVIDARGQSVKRFQLLQTDEEEQALQASGSGAASAAPEATTAVAETSSVASSTPAAAATSAATPVATTTSSTSSSCAPALTSASAAAATSTVAVCAAPAAAATVPAPLLPCSNPGCPNPFVVTMVCARCHSGVRYCGAACQRADWKASHQARCMPASSLRLQAVRDLLKKKDTLGYVEALRMLAAIHATYSAATAAAAASSSSASSSSALIPAEELAAATVLEHSLRTEIRSKLFDVQCLYKHPCPLFTGEEDEKSTWHRTLQQALEWMPLRSRPQAVAAAQGQATFTSEKPLVVYFLACRESSEGLTDFRALGQHVLGGVPTLLVLIGHPTNHQEEGLDHKPDQKFGALTVRRVMGNYPEVASAASSSAAAAAAAALPQPHLVVMFHSRVDVSFGSWSRSVDSVLSLEPPPALVLSGYSTDDSHLQNEDLLRVAMGAQVVLPTRRSAFGCAMFKPHVSNSHITVAQGFAPGFKPASNPEQRRAQINKAKTDMQARGFQLSDC